jgi:hypothetical protein
MAEKILSVEVKGLDKVVASIQNLAGDIQRELAAVLYQEGEGLITEAKQEVPVDTGVLRASGYVRWPEYQGSTVTVQVGFGGAAAPYALLVHENLESRHNPPTKAKYLEDPFNRRLRGLDERVGAKLEARLA